MKEAKFGDMVGEKIEDIEMIKSKDEGDIVEIHFYTRHWDYSLYHNQDCCEYVYVADICGDVEDLVGEVITLSEEVHYGRDEVPPLVKAHEVEESFTWTFYKLGTIKGVVTFRWIGTSNGYYSESVEFGKLVRKKRKVG